MSTKDEKKIFAEYVMSCLGLMPNPVKQLPHKSFEATRKSAHTAFVARTKEGYLFPLPPTNAEIDVIFRSIAVFDGLDNRRAGDKGKKGTHK